MSSEDRPPSFRDIAARLGVSVAAVSMAMRDSPRISAKLRSEVKRTAEEMNYRPNPLLSVYQSNVRSRKPTTFRAVLGWINDWDEDSWERPYMKPLLAGAQERAEALGFQIDQIWIPDMRKDDWEWNYKHWERILRARGIQGVFLPSMTRTEYTLLEWRDFSVVCLGKYHVSKSHSSGNADFGHPHHRVCTDHFYDMQLALRMLHLKGCERIGLALSHWLDLTSDFGYSSIFARAALDLPAKNRVPILFADHPAAVTPWVKKYRPDAVVCGNIDVREGIERAGLKIPEQVRLVHMNIAPDVANWTGVDRRQKYQGHGAVDLLAAHLIRNERGIPLFAKEMNIEGVWVDGET